MKPIFIIEGADKCGKSALCEHLIDKFKCNYIHNGKYKENPFANYNFAMDILKTFEGQPSLILDRYVLSNYVYSNVFKDGEDPLPRNVWVSYRKHFDRVARNHGYKPIWIVTAPSKCVWEGLFEDSAAQGNELYTNFEKMNKVYDMMVEEANIENLLLFNWCFDSDYTSIDSFIDKELREEQVRDENSNTVQIKDLMSYFRFQKDINAPMINGTYELLNYKFNMDPTKDIEFEGYPINRAYHDRELKWYLSLDRSIIGWMEDIKIWNAIASKDEKREINSNYGWCAFSVENGSQYMHVLETLEKDPSSRQAQFVYTRPNIHTDWNKDGRHDFICTNTIQVFIRENKLFYKIDQRSLDTITGLKADWYWHIFVYNKLLNDLSQTYPNLKPGTIMWNVGSCHIYERSFKSLDKMTDAM